MEVVNANSVGTTNQCICEYWCAALCLAGCAIDTALPFLDFIMSLSMGSYYSAVIYNSVG